MFEQKQLCVKVVRMFVCLGFSLTLTVNISFWSKSSTVVMCLYRRSDLYPFLIGFCLSCEQKARSVQLLNVRILLLKRDYRACYFSMIWGALN